MLHKHKEFILVPMKSMLPTLIFIFIMGLITQPEGLVAQSTETPPKEMKGLGGGKLHIFPLGWSSEGKWGTLIGKEASSNSSTGTLKMLIFDSVSDEILYESKEVTWSTPGSIEKFWNRNAPTILKIMRSFNLQYSTKVDVRGARFITGGVKYTFSLTPPSPADGAYALQLNSSRGDSKNVYKSSKESTPKRTWLQGAIISPFEQRALAILREQSGTKGEMQYRFSGAHLLVGFVSSSSPAKEQQGNLITAIFNGQEYLVQSRLAGGADPNTQDKRGYPALLVAARLGHWQIVIDLLKAGAQPNAQDDSGRTALHHAAFANNTEAVRALLSSGADIKIRDAAKRSPEELSADAKIRKLLQ